MRYRINQVKLNIDEQHDALENAIRKKLKRRKLNICDIEIVKESIDARKKPDIKLVYTVDFSCDEVLPLDEAKKREYMLPTPGEKKLSRQCEQAGRQDGETGGELRPVVVGFGPCGIFAALILAEAGLRPIVIERGEAVDDRVRTVSEFWRRGELDYESNVQFGEGGAGTFSDGKLTTGTKDIRIAKVLAEFVEAGAESSILYKQKPHIGTDKLRCVVKNIRKKIEALGGEVRFNTKLTGLGFGEKYYAPTAVSGLEPLENNVVSGLNSSLSDSLVCLKSIRMKHRLHGEETIEADCLILAIGHSARDTFTMLFEQGICIEQKPFSIGVRIEHPQEMINEAQYGDTKAVKRLGPADYKLNHRCENGRGVYTFCMCPGGEVINASSEAETAVTNGMSNSNRDGKYANSGLLVDVRTDDFASDHPLAGVEFQRKYEKLAYINGRGSLPQSDYGKFKSDSDDPVRNSLPRFASAAIIESMPYLGKKLIGFDSDDAVMTAVETRSSSPVRIKRNENYSSNINGLFPGGEGAGYAGGIISAAVDGIKIAERIIARK